MANKNKNKGKSWERDICSELSRALDGSFMRVPNSGAAVGGLNAFRKNSMSNNQIHLAKGDIIPPDELPKMVIEAKSYKDFPFHQLLTNGDCKQLNVWIEQTLDCVDDNDVWFVIFKINNKSSYIVFENKYFNNFKLQNYVKYKNFIVTEFIPFLNENSDSIKTLCK